MVLGLVECTSGRDDLELFSPREFQCPADAFHEFFKRKGFGYVFDSLLSSITGLLR